MAKEAGESMTGSEISAARDPEWWRAYESKPLPRILEAALEAFAAHGYDGTSVRDIAAASGLSVPGVYHYHRSKQEILMSLLESVMLELLSRSRAALEFAEARPDAQFVTLVESLLRFHMFRRAQAFVASTELRSLEPDNRVRCVALRDEQQHMIRDVVRAGCEAGCFTTPYPDDAARAISTLCVGVAAWYREDGALTPEEIVERHLVLSRGLVGASSRG